MVVKNELQLELTDWFYGNQTLEMLREDHHFRVILLLVIVLSIAYRNIYMK